MPSYLILLYQNTINNNWPRVRAMKSLIILLVSHPQVHICVLLSTLAQNLPNKYFPLQGVT